MMQVEIDKNFYSKVLCGKYLLTPSWSMRATSILTHAKKKKEDHGPSLSSHSLFINEGLNILWFLPKDKLKSHNRQDFSNSDSCGMCFHFEGTDSLVSLAHEIKAGHSQLPVTKNTKV